LDIDNIVIFGGNQLDVILEQMSDDKEMGEDLFSQSYDINKCSIEVPGASPIACLASSITSGVFSLACRFQVFVPQIYFLENSLSKFLTNQRKFEQDRFQKFKKN
jgi:hypothetical protein